MLIRRASSVNEQEPHYVLISLLLNPKRMSWIYAAGLQNPIYANDRSSVVLLCY